MKKLVAAAFAALALSSCSLIDEIEIPENVNSDIADAAEEPVTTEFSYSDFINGNDGIFSGGDISDSFGLDDGFFVDVPAASGGASDSAPDTEVPEPAGEPSGERHSIEVPYLSQKKYPSGCEIVSSAMLLQFYGFGVEPADLINGGYISYQLLDRDGDDELFGGDPNKIFIGDPFSIDGYGCYSRTIFNALKSYLENELFDTAYLTGMTLGDLCELYIDYGQPVLIWATSGMEPTNKKPPVTWRIDGTDDMFTWIPNEHCMVLVGYDDENYYFNDPLTGQDVPYERALTELRYGELGRQAVTIHPWE